MGPLFRTRKNKALPSEIYDILCEYWICVFYGQSSVKYHVLFLLGTVNLQTNKRFRKHLYGSCICIETCIFKCILSDQDKLSGVWKWNKTLRRTLAKIIEGLPNDWRNISNIILHLMCSLLYTTVPLKFFFLNT